MSRESDQFKGLREREREGEGESEEMVVSKASIKFVLFENQRFYT